MRIYGESTRKLPAKATPCTGPTTTHPRSMESTPNNSFLRYLSILNSIQGYSISGRRLYLTREDLDKRDPLRGGSWLPLLRRQRHPFL